GRGNWSGGGQAPDWSGGGIDAIAESRFRRMDKNNDGVLDADEMDEALLAEKDKWDTNHDGVIDPQEYKVYFAARMKQIQADRENMNPFGPAPRDDEDTEKKPTVYRSGKLPKELPAWFAQLDTDGDMQIGLYEWKNSGRPLRQFLELDRNGDGFLTIEEVLYAVATGKEQGGGNGNGSSMAGMPGGGP